MSDHPTPVMPALVSLTADAVPALRHRHDGWTPERQRGFCEAIAEGETVADACARVGMAVSTAYALRRRAGGAAFALGWDAARLLGRERLGDDLHARAIAGNIDTVTRPDGSTITRHRYDNRLAAMMLRRADRYAEGQAGAQGQAARLVAAEFDAFLDVIARDEGPARAGLFLGTRIGGEDADALAPIAALARADTWLRTGAGRGAEVDIADLDPAQRAHWSAEQWARAEAAGLLALAPPPPPPPARAAPPAAEAEDVTSPPLPPLWPPEAREHPVWWSDLSDGWRTSFAPPEGFSGTQEGVFGDPDYERELDTDERLLLDAAQKAGPQPDRVKAAQDREAWFATLGGDILDQFAGTADAEEVKPAANWRDVAHACDLRFNPLGDALGPPVLAWVDAVLGARRVAASPDGDAAPPADAPPIAAAPPDLPNGPVAPI